MSCDKRCFDPADDWYGYEDCKTCPGRDDGSYPLLGEVIPIIPEDFDPLFGAVIPIIPEDFKTCPGSDDGNYPLLGENRTESHRESVESE